MEALLESPYIQTVGIIALSILLAYLTNWILGKQIRRLAAKTETTFDDRAVELVHKPVFVTVLTVGLTAATRRLELPFTVTWITVGVLKSVAILVWMTFGFRFANLLRDVMLERGEHSPLPERTLPLFNNLAKVVVAGLAFYFFFLIWSIDVTAWLASAGIIGIAIGFAAKDTLANLFAGVFILVDAPYKVGDFIMLSTGERGLVTHIGIRSTRVLTRDDIEITVPNAIIGAAKITNESGGRHEKRRLRIPVQVAYGSDIDVLREVLMTVADEHEEVSKRPVPRVRFRTFADSGLNFELLCWIEKPVLKGRVIDALNTVIYKRLPNEGLSIPYPVRDVRIVQGENGRTEEQAAAGASD